MCIIKWNGPEEDIGCCCVAISFAVESIEESADGKKISKGAITGKDYIEGGITFSDPWEAIGEKQANGSLIWQVKRPNDSTAFWINRETGEAYFTANSDVNEGMKRFIANKLNEFLANGRFITSVEKYTGPKDEYKGQCVCHRLKASNPQNSFPWEEMTNGGRFPKCCFLCSCGKKWWCYNSAKNLWAPVLDSAAWEMLTTHNGMEIQKLGYLEKGFHLLQTLRDRGFIPLPT